MVEPEVGSADEPVAAVDRDQVEPVAVLVDVGGRAPSGRGDDAAVAAADDVLLGIEHIEAPVERLLEQCVRATEDRSAGLGAFVEDGGGVGRLWR